MRLLTIIIGLLLLFMTPSIESKAKSSPPKTGAKNCVPEIGCLKEEESSDCCTPPPCEFWDALEQATARTKMLSGKMLQVAPGEEGTYTEAHYSEFMEDMSKEFKKIRKQHPKCPKQSKSSDVPIFSVHPDYNSCKVSTYVNKSFQNLYLSDVFKTTTACNEIVEARFEAASVSEAYCEMGAGYAERAKEQYEKALRERTVLEDHLIRYWRVCSIVPDSEAARIVAENSVKNLKKIQSQKQSPQKKASRATKSRQSR